MSGVKGQSSGESSSEPTLQKVYGFDDALVSPPSEGIGMVMLILN